MKHDEVEVDLLQQCCLAQSGCVLQTHGLGIQTAELTQTTDACVPACARVRVCVEKRREGRGPHHMQSKPRSLNTKDSQSREK